MTFEDHKNAIDLARKKYNEAIDCAKLSGYDVKTELCGGQQYIYHTKLGQTIR